MPSTADKLYKEYKKLSSADRRAFLEQIKNEANNKITAYTMAVEPLTEAQYIAEIQKAIIEADSEQTITADQLAANIGTWK